MLHNITRPRPWRGEAQVIEDVFEESLKKVEVQKQEWKEGWQVDTPRTHDGRQAVGTPTFENGKFQKGDKQLQGKHRSWS